jgi:hypothetical protein
MKITGFPRLRKEQETISRRTRTRGRTRGRTRTRTRGGRR